MLGSPSLCGEGRIVPPCSVPRKKTLPDTIAFGQPSLLRDPSYSVSSWDYIQERASYPCSVHPEAKSCGKAACSHEVEGCIMSE